MFPQSLSTFDEIGDPNEILKAENLLDFDYQELQTKYNILCKTYAEEVETSNKIKKSLGKCLKFYSKLCKKYEAQQMTIDSLQKTIKQKMSCLEESLKNQEKMKGLIDVYKRERILYCAESNFNLQKDKEILLDVCCKLISESVRTNNIRNLTNLILKKFKNDLDEEKINLLKEKQVFTKSKSDKLKNSVLNLHEPDLKHDVLENKFVMTKDIKNLENVNLEESKNFELNKLEKLNLDSSEFLKTESKETCKIPTENVMKRKKDLEQVNGCYPKENKLFSDEDEKEKNKFKINEKFPNILPLSSNSLPHAKKVDIDFVEINSNCNNTESGNKVNVNMNRNMDFKNTEKDDERKFHISKINTNAETILLFDQKKEKTSNVEISNFNSCELKQKNKDIYKMEELLFENNCKKEKPLVDGTKEISSKIVPEFFNRNVQENFTVKLNQIEVKDSDNKETLNSKSNSIDLILDSSISLLDIQKNLEETRAINMDLKNGVSLDLNKRDAAHAEKNRNEKAVLQNPSSLSKSLEITANKQVNSEIYVQNDSDNLNCQSDVIDLFNCSEKELNNFPNSDSDGEAQSKELDWEKLEIVPTELSHIFNEMSTLRLLSPIREINESHQTPSPNKEKNNDKKMCQKSPESKSQSSNQDLGIKQEKRKSITCDSSECKKIKLNKKKNCVIRKKETANGLLDTIMEAMSTQNAQFKSNTNNKTEVPVPPEQALTSYFQVQNVEKSISQVFKTHLQFSSVADLTQKNNKEVVQQKIQCSSKVNQLPEEKKKENKLNFENSVTQKIQQFISSSISSNEEAQKNVTDCLAGLEHVSATAIAKSVVGLVLANIDEKVEIFERPVPPLTRTQCRLVTLLSLLKTKNSKFEKIVDIIMEEISSKLFPDNFFWPDDSVEMACRFYTALCKNRNDLENLWKFCLQAMMYMKQRSPVVIFTVLKTWPDILHKEPTLKNNILATTIVNIILHTSLNNTLANGNQKKNLLGLKHLLMNFYGFKVNNTIEEFADILLESFFKNESVAEKSLVLLIKCREVAWTSKHIFPKLGKALKEWSQNPVDEDVLGHRVLGVLKQTAPIFSENKKNFQNEVQIFISFLSDALTFGNLSHESEQKVVEILLCLKRYPEVKERIREWIPKGVVKEHLRNEILNLSSENILQELKFNRGRDLLENRNTPKKKRKKLGNKSKNRKGKNKNFRNKQCKGKLKN